MSHQPVVSDPLASLPALPVPEPEDAPAPAAVLFSPPLTELSADKSSSAETAPTVTALVPNTNVRTRIKVMIFLNVLLILKSNLSKAKVYNI